MKRTVVGEVGAYTSRVSRRDFIRAAGGGAPLAAASALVFDPARADAAQRPWDHEADVVVVGTGAAGGAAALFAAEGGAKVLVIEKARTYGGATALSGGGFHIPNNARMRAAGIVDRREDALRFYARTAYSTLYHPDMERFGLPENEYGLLEAFYDNGTAVIDRLAAIGALRFGPWLDFENKDWPDYYAHIPEDKAPRGRTLMTRSATSEEILDGAELIRQLKAAMDQRMIPVLMRHRAVRLVQNPAREVVGLEATDGNGAPVAIGARKGVIFASGGFTHNPELRRMLRGPVYSGCGPLTNEGDIVPITTAIGAKLSNMANAWWHPQILELALQSSATGLSGGNPGDSMIIVDKYGRRIANEMKRYNDRGQMFFEWDPVKVEFKNHLLFMLFDQRTRDLYQRITPIPGKDVQAPWLIQADSWAGLSSAIKDRLQSLESKIHFRLDGSFADNLPGTVERYNRFAAAGADPDFHRGESPAELSGHGARRPGNDHPNLTMCPIADRGPYYAIILCGGTLETKGGPKINASAQILDTADQPIPGLYGAGNCIGSPAGEAYWGGGSTIGPALVFGGIAGRHAAAGAARAIRKPA